LYFVFKGEYLKYSIIIPTLNEEKLLPKLLDQFDSIDVKNKYDSEIIISDGGSNDNTVEIASGRADIVKEYEGIEKQTIASGRNIGAKSAFGEILIFLNGDILLNNPQSFFEFVNNIFAPSEYLAMTCRVKVFPEEEKLSDILFHGFYNSYFHFLNILGVGMGRGECQVIRRRIFEEVGGNKESLIAGEDFDLFMRIRKLGKVLYTNEVWVYESPRRYRKLGYFGVTWEWLKNSSSIIFRKKSISKEWEQVR
jgi:glycosyltransferase involved in cell wall biosynthesis